MRELTVGKRAQFTMIVSDGDWAFLRNWPWTFARSHPGGVRELIYARRGVIVSEAVPGSPYPFRKRFDLFVHHVVLARMGYPAPPQPHWTADHINHNTLDNRRENLRWASPSYQAKRQRARLHPEFVAQALEAMLAAHTWPVIPDWSPAPAPIGV